MENILKCENCGEWLIAEESTEHVCLNRFDSILFDSDGTYSFDGKNWYEFPPKNKHPFKTPDDSTEPFFGLKGNCTLECQ